MGKENKDFSIIMALGMVFIAVFSFVCPIEYFQHIADAIVLPLFLLTILEAIGHIKDAVLGMLNYELNKAKTNEIWMNREYNIWKDDTDEPSENIKKEYESLIRNIIKLDQSKLIVKRKFKYYKWLYNLIGAILVASVITANIPFMIKCTSDINTTTITLFTFVIFIIEPKIVDFFAYRVADKVFMEVNAWEK